MSTELNLLALGAAALLTGGACPGPSGQSGNSTPPRRHGSTTQASPPRSSGGFTLKLDRPYRRGQRYQYAFHGEIRRQQYMLVDGKREDVDNTAVVQRYEADVTVNRVDRRGNPTRETHRVTKFLVRVGQKDTYLLRSGQVIRATLRGGKESFELQGGQLGRTARGILARVVDLIRDGKGPDESVFVNSASPHRAGDSWSLPSSPFLALIRRRFKPMMRLSRRDLKGRVTLIEAAEFDGVLSLKWKAAVTLNRFVPNTGLKGARPIEGTLKLKYEGRVPVDPNAPPIRAKRRVRFDFVLAMPFRGKPARMHATMDYLFRESRTPIR